MSVWRRGRQGHRSVGCGAFVGALWWGNGDRPVSAAPQGGRYLTAGRTRARHRRHYGSVGRPSYNPSPPRPSLSPPPWIDAGHSWDAGLTRCRHRDLHPSPPRPPPNAMPPAFSQHLHVLRLQPEVCRANTPTSCNREFCFIRRHRTRRTVRSAPASGSIVGVEIACAGGIPLEHRRYQHCVERSTLCGANASHSLSPYLIAAIHPSPERQRKICNQAMYSINSNPPLAERGL